MNGTKIFSDSCIKMQLKQRILLIDDQWGRADDPMIPGRYGQLPCIEWRLEAAEETPGVYSAMRALKRIRQEQPDVVLLDIMFGGEQSRLGVEILKCIRSEFPALPVIMFTSLESEENRELVVRCMELGANEYLEKAPSDAQMQAVLSVYAGTSADKATYGNCETVRSLRALVARVALAGNTNVLVYGESGTGKELVARSIHRQGPRREGPFVPLNCAFLELETLESELFGHEPGSFTGARLRRVGLLEHANGGMLFLDEIANMPQSLQGKLLRVLQERRFRRMGSNNEIESDFQLVCATNRLPEQLVRDGKLREDFYYRVAAVTLQVPPLRERQEDVPFLAEMFLRRLKEHDGYAAYPGKRFSSNSLRLLQVYAWPGNVRELENLVERSLIFSTEETIEVADPSVNRSSLGDQAAAQPSIALSSYSDLPADSTLWAKTRFLSELRTAVEAKRRIKGECGERWMAEFMRRMYPNYKPPSAEGFKRWIKRLTTQLGIPRYQDDPAIKRLLDELTAR